MKPQITLDMKKGRIRIHKSSLKMLDFPDFIYILVNPGTKKIAICKAKESDKDAIRISTDVRSYCDIYSKELMFQISSLNDRIVSNVSCCLSGEKKNDYLEYDVHIFEVLEK